MPFDGREWPIVVAIYKFNSYLYSSYFSIGIIYVTVVSVILTKLVPF